MNTQQHQKTNGLYQTILAHWLKRKGRPQPETLTTVDIADMTGKSTRTVNDWISRDVDPLEATFIRNQRRPCYYVRTADWIEWATRNQPVTVGGVQSRATRRRAGWGITQRSAI